MYNKVYKPFCFSPLSGFSGSDVLLALTFAPPTPVAAGDSAGVAYDEATTIQTEIVSDLSTLSPRIERLQHFYLTPTKTRIDDSMTSRTTIVDCDAASLTTIDTRNNSGTRSTLNELHGNLGVPRDHSGPPNVGKSGYSLRSFSTRLETRRIGDVDATGYHTDITALEAGDSGQVVVASLTLVRYFAPLALPRVTCGDNLTGQVVALPLYAQLNPALRPFYQGLSNGSVSMETSGVVVPVDRLRLYESTSTAYHIADSSVSVSIVTETVVSNVRPITAADEAFRLGD